MTVFGILILVATHISQSLGTLYFFCCALLLGTTNPTNMATITNLSASIPSHHYLTNGATEDDSADFRDPESLIVKREEFLIAPPPAVEDVRDENLAKIEISILCLIFSLAVIGNGLMLFALHRQLKFRPMSRMYYFMLNLSLADLLVAFGHILPQIAWDITFRFRGNDILCRAVKFSQVFVLYLSTFILTSMAIDRYFVVCHPSFSRNHYSGIKGPKTLITVSWILSILLSVPQPIIFSYQEVQDGIYDCWVNFVSPWDKVYVTWFVISAFLLPLVIILGSYGAICIKVVRFNLPPSAPKNGIQIRNGNKMRPLVSSSSEKTSDDALRSTDDVIQIKGGSTERQALKRQISRAKIKTLKLTLVIVICFIICFAPFCITQLIMVYNPPASAKQVEPMKVIFMLLASLNSCTNPWIYIFFSESLYNQLRMCLRIGLLRGSNEESIGDEQVVPAAPKPKKPRRIIADLQEHPLNERIMIKIEDHGGGDENVAETKSDILPNTSKDKGNGTGTTTPG